MQEIRVQGDFSLPKLMVYVTKAPGGHWEHDTGIQAWVYAA